MGTGKRKWKQLFIPFWDSNRTHINPCFIECFAVIKTEDGVQLSIEPDGISMFRSGVFFEVDGIRYEMTKFLSDVYRDENGKVIWNCCRLVWGKPISPVDGLELRRKP